MTVLHEYTYNNGADALIFLVVAIGIALLAGMLTRWAIYDLLTYEKAAISILTAVISFGMVYAIIKLPQAMATTRYKVTLEENVDLNEFLKQYRIVKTEGEIIIIEQIEHGE